MLPDNSQKMLKTDTAKGASHIRITILKHSEGFLCDTVFLLQKNK